MTSGLREKSFRRVFWDILSRNHDFFGKNFCFQVRISSLTPQLSTLGTLLIWDGICQTVVGFCSLLRWQNFLSQLNFVWSWDSYLKPLLLSHGCTLNLCCFLMVVLCLISPNFATCSVTLHKHVVSVVVKRLGTFASLALSTSAPMFSFSIRVVGFKLRFGGFMFWNNQFSEFYLLVIWLDRIESIDFLCRPSEVSFYWVDLKKRTILTCLLSVTAV